MVRLTKIYTRTGDKGKTSLGDGSRVAKTSLRVEAYGAVDEANAAIGHAVACCGGHAEQGLIREALLAIQHDLFDLGADLCVPLSKGEMDGARLRITPAQSGRIEGLIDKYNENLPTLESFVLPGGSELAARLHLARTAARSAERRIAALLEAEPGATNPETLVYMNRLSDLLFVLARVANEHGAEDVLWKPGKNRSPSEEGE